MASVKEKKEVLARWAELFPSHTEWKNQFLIKRVGPLVTGICLDETRDPKAYSPVFFLHNLLVPSEVLSLGYGVAYHYRAGRVAVRYGSDVEEAVTKFSSQVGLLHSEMSYDAFLQQIRSALRPDVGCTFAYLPHALRDAILVGCYLGDRDFFLSALDDACDLIRRFKRVNIRIIGSVEAWKESVEALAQQLTDEQLERNANALGLPTLKQRGMDYTRPVGFPECLIA